MKIAVLGTGAIGSCIGADLSAAGLDVLLLDQWPEHVEAMKKNGLGIRIDGGESLDGGEPSRAENRTKVRAAHLHELVSLNDKFDIVMLTAKSCDTCWMAELVRPYLTENGYIVSLQNSLNNERLFPIIGYRKNVGAVVELSAELYEPGIVKRNTGRDRTWFAVGELHGRTTSRIENLAGILVHAGKVETTTNIWGAKWSKLVANAMMQGLSAFLGLPDYEATAIPAVFEVCLHVGREAVVVGRALGYEMEAIYGLKPEQFQGSTDEVLKTNLGTLRNHIGKKSMNSVYQDHVKGRSSEVDYLNGLIVEKGEELGIPVPFNRHVVRLTGMIRDKKISPSIVNLPLIEALTGTVPSNTSDNII